MTICVGWTEGAGRSQRLIFASDSRLSGLYRWDTAQKLFILPGVNVVIGFAGQTTLALPVIDQVRASCANYKKLRDGASDVSEVKSHVLAILNSMISNYDKAYRRCFNDDYVDSCSETELIIGGYSHYWREFKLWKIAYDVRADKFRDHTARNFGRSKLVVAGNRERPDNYQEEFVKKLVLKMKGREGEVFGLEPLDILVDMLRGGREYIGGAPQIMMSYNSGRSLPYATFWESLGKRRVHLFGRPLLPYEKTEFFIIDPMTHAVFSPLDTISNSPIIGSDMLGL